MIIMKKSKHYLYNTWDRMKCRCSNPNEKHYHRYGGRGITVCKRWLDDFWNFVEDMGERPEGLTLDRIDNDKGYSPDNCRWATRKAQSANTIRRTNAKGIVLRKDTGKWLARVRHSGKQLLIGNYDCPLIARIAYEDKLRELEVA